MEKFLTTWIKDQTHKCIPLGTRMITAKAKCVFAMLTEEVGPNYDDEFTGWFK